MKAPLVRNLKPRSGRFTLRSGARARLSAGDGIGNVSADLRLLLAEDDRALAEVLARGLQEDGYVLDVVDRGDDALHMLRLYDYAAAVLDWRMPGMEGAEVVREARRLKIATPVLMLTARDTVTDRVQGLDSGADDYLVKPVAFPELLARLRAIQRRPRQGSAPHLAVGNLTLDPATRLVQAGGQPVLLTNRELGILEILMRRSPAVVDRVSMARHAWMEEEDAAGSNTIDVHVGRLRRKLARAEAAVQVVTVRGVGHRVVPA
ncbi:MAG TPA: response regulator transcription factor [Candidatus Acidoferrales bacterium]|nr:response regulator transcription factor [Candidatus Acidoferrales bacterium]